MRYRGPIESIKINNFKQDLSRDIIEISAELANYHNQFKQYLTETFMGSDKEVEVFDGMDKVFQCMDNVRLSRMMSNPVSLEFGRQDRKVILYINDKPYRTFQANIGDTIELPDAPQKEGYDFVEWVVE